MRFNGFVDMSNAFGRILSFEVVNKEETVMSMFAFAYSFMDRMSEIVEQEKRLVEKATSVIKKYIDEGKVIHLEEYPFPFLRRAFIVANSLLEA